MVGDEYGRSTGWGSDSTMGVVADEGDTEAEGGDFESDMDLCVVLEDGRRLAFRELVLDCVAK